MSNKPTQKTEQPILLVDDDRAFREIYRELLTQEGYKVTEAEDRPAALRSFQSRDFPVVLLDLMLPPDGQVEAGLQQLTELLSVRPSSKIIILSGAGDVPHMLKAVRSGAYDFLTKPVDPDVLLIVIQRAMARHALERQLEGLQASLAARRPDGAMIGQSPSFLKALRMAEQFAASDLPVLITGETGTGKELMARFIHQLSGRGETPLLAVNCGALPEGLLESTLFGHTKGAFTGATAARRGLFVEAHQGTLFLDEIGDMPAPLQVKVLRALESGEILPVGADQPTQVDVRLISATNCALETMQGNGEFREDLYWRIKGAEVELPPLRERPGDVALLAAFFLNQSGSLSPDGRPRVLSEGALQLMAEHSWPGNLRELRFEMQRATVLAGARAEILPEDLSLARGKGNEMKEDGDGTLPQKVEALERREISAALARLHGNRTHTAEKLGLSRQGLLKKMGRYRLG